MGLKRTNRVSGDEEGLLNWGQAMLQSVAPEQSKPQQQSESLKCPRCGSMSTKFCYYNNYNRSQPRHFCKSCKRHWTKGGTLRNVPIGGGRKNKRPRVSAPKIPSTSAAARSNFNVSSNTSNNQKFRASSISLSQTLIQPPTPSFEETTDRTINNIVDTKNFNSGNRFDSTGLIEEDRNPIMEFHLSALNSYECNYTANLESMEESTITTVNMDPSSSGSGAWGGFDASSPLELASYWNWSEMDALTSSEEVNGAAWTRLNPNMVE